MLGLFLAFSVIFFLVSLLAYSHFVTVKKLRKRNNRISTIIYEDVVLRIKEANSMGNALERLRKIREAHASFETISAMMGGFDIVAEELGIDVDRMDSVLSEEENLCRQDKTLRALSKNEDVQVESNERDTEREKTK